MNNTCPICGKQFKAYDLRKKYCSAECAYKARLNSNNKRMAATRTANKRAWARKEPRYLNHLAYECGVDCLTDYVYNNYKKKGK